MWVSRFRLNIISEDELLRRLGQVYRDGYHDGEDGSPFGRGYWLGTTSREASGLATGAEVTP